MLECIAECTGWYRGCCTADAGVQLGAGLSLHANTPASEITQVNRNQIQVKSVEGILWDQTEIMAQFNTWGARHDLVAGVEGGQEISNPIAYAYTINGINTVPNTTLLNPNEAQPFGGHGLHHVDCAHEIQERGALFHRYDEAGQALRVERRRALGSLRYRLQSGRADCRRQA